MTGFSTNFYDYSHENSFSQVLLRSDKVSKGVIFCGKTYDYLNLLRLCPFQHQHWPEGRISLAKNSMTVWWIPIVMSHWVCWHFPMEKPILMSTCPKPCTPGPFLGINRTTFARPASVRIIHGWQQIRVEFFINLLDPKILPLMWLKGLLKLWKELKNECRKRRYFARFWP